MAEQDHANGFTLVEVLVALVVTSLMLTILMNGALLARARGRAAEDKRAAVSLAASLLERASAASPSDPSITRGTEGALGWTIERVEVASEPRRLVALYAWRVTVSDRGGKRLISVPTRRLLPVPRGA